MMWGKKSSNISHKNIEKFLESIYVLELIETTRDGTKTVCCAIAKNEKKKSLFINQIIFVFVVGFTGISREKCTKFGFKIPVSSISGKRYKAEEKKAHTEYTPNPNAKFESGTEDFSS